MLDELERGCASVRWLISVSRRRNQVRLAASVCELAGKSGSLRGRDDGDTVTIGAKNSQMISRTLLPIVRLAKRA